MKRKIAIAALTATVGLVAPAVRAEDPPGPDTAGFHLGIGLGADFIDAEDERPGAPAGSVFIEDGGGAVTLTVGYGFTPSFEARLVASGANHETNDPDIDVGLGCMTIEAAYHFRAGQPFRPELYGGLGGWTANSRFDEYDLELEGPGMVFGTGFDYFLSDHFALDFDMRLELINWEEGRASRKQGDGSTVVVDLPTSDDGGGIKILFGAGWWF